MNSSSPWKVLALVVLAGSAVAQTDCGTVATSEIVGPGTAGTAGVPVLEQIGWPAVGGRFGLRVVDAPPLAPGLLVASTALSPTPFPDFGATAYPALPGVTQVFTTNLAGRTGVLFEIDPVPAALCGFEAIGQAIAVDVGATGGLAFTAGRHAVFGEVPEPVLPQRVLVPVAEAMEWLDVDNDGRTDLVTSEFLFPSHRITLHRNLGGGEFAASESWTIPGSFEVNLESGDLDGDGTADLVAHDLGLNRPWVLLGQDGGFADPVASADNGNSVFGSRLIDFDRDGVLDLVSRPAEGVSSPPFDQPTVALGQGNGTFMAPTFLGLGSGATGLVVEDFDLDGFDELLLSRPSTALALDAPAGQSLALSQTLDSSIGARTGGFGDRNGDGLVDLVLVAEDAIEVHLGTPTGSFATPSVHPVEGTTTGDVQLLDLDDDGVNEIVATTTVPAGPFEEDRREIVVFGDGENGLERTGGFGARVSSASFEWLDLDDDGERELAVLGLDVPGNRGDVTVLESDGEIGFFSAYPLRKTPGAVRDGALGDLDLDGSIDLVVARGQDLMPAESLRGDGLDNFIPTFTTSEPIPTDEVALGDVNADGILDLVALSRTFAGLAVMIGHADGSFGPELGFDTLVGAFALQAADLNGDGRSDVVMRSSFAESDFFVHFGTPGFILGPAVEYTLTPPPGEIDPSFDLILLDADGDGNTDVAVSRLEATFLFLGDGAGGFTNGPTIPLGSGTLLPVDLDLDGDTDLVMERDGLVPLENLGDATFTIHPAIIDEEPDNFGNAVAADVLGDDRPEILRSSTSESAVELVTTGNGFQFAPAGRFAIGDRAFDLLSAEVDQDDGPEILSLSTRARILPTRE